MRITKAACAAYGFAILFGTAANAGEDPSYDWSGFTAGVIGSFNTGKDAWQEADWVEYALEDSGFLGIFAAYDHSVSNVVIGARISGQFGSMKEKTDLYHEEYNNIYDINGRVGFARDNLLMYATAGYSIYEHWDDGTSHQPHGYNIGVGAQYAIQNNVVVGVEYLHRKVDTICPHDMGFKHDIDSVQVNIGYKF